jgi:oligosaccharide amylase
MPRDLPVGNGSLLVNVDHTGQIRDIFWPHVGQENHTSGRVCRLGVWVDDRFSWLENNSWQRKLRYGKDSLITDSILKNKSLGLRLLLRDGVDFHENLLVRQITVENNANRDREIRLFFCHDFSLSGTTVGDSAYYEPSTEALFHYKGKRWFMIGLFRGWPGNWKFGLDQWAIGVKRINGLEGSWRDAEDGILSGNPVAQGRIDSVVACHLQVPAKGQASCWQTLAVGLDFRTVTKINQAVLRKGPLTYLERTAAYWRLWANKERETFSRLPSRLVTLYRRSLLILRTQIDNEGAILAANDHDIAQFNRDTYSYMWPRDGALVTATLIDAGYSELSRKFFDFCHRAITDQGFLLHKYTPDGSLASSWHAWYKNGKPQLPIQEDETALVLWALWQHFTRFRDIEFVKRHYRGLVIRAAEWICSYIDKDTGLPLPSWDLWEERYGVHSWTVAAVWAGLQAAANFAEAFGENELSMRYQRVAAAMKAGAQKYLYNQEEKRFVRSLLVDDKRSARDMDMVMDSSLIGLWVFGLFEADDPLVVRTMEAMRHRLWIQSDVGGMARYENDYYHQVSDDTEKIPGNPWFICTLWLGQWFIAAATKTEDLQPALECIEWAANHTLESGVMAEQVHPHTNEPLSVSPLTWSHATYVNSIIQYNNKLAKLTANDE